MTEDVELCGVQTPTGPCTLKKGHRLNYHRHRLYEQVTWEILSVDNKLLEEGKARVPLNYAVTRQLEEHDKLVIHITRWNGPNPSKLKEHDK